MTLQGDENDLIRAQMAQILASRDFTAPDRNRRFLSYVVDETLAGRSDRIKAYTIATTVFGRGEDFNSQLDSIVRIEAGRLRRSLEHYYLTAGANDALVITIPRGGYVPAFALAAPLANRNAEPVKGLVLVAQTPSDRPAICVAPFDCDGTDLFAQQLAGSFTRQTMVELTHFAELFAFDRYIAEQDQAMQVAPVAGKVRFLISGSTSLEDNVLTVSVLLLDTLTGRYLWAEQFERAEVSGRLQQVRNEIVQMIAGPRGALRNMIIDATGGEIARPKVQQGAIVRLRSGETSVT